jgi:hypothetical protein
MDFIIQWKPFGVGSRQYKQICMDSARKYREWEDISFIAVNADD